ncbi:hypothetical protein TUM12370_16130 [Salmonella enterica subsp. enterica serovar Choleraesuis]|nr:hypothetical protein TUM12370_16130 [Salmonella enterica subsp. enterica serovar Choleraesuis]
MTISRSLLIARCEHIKAEPGFKQAALAHARIMIELYQTNPSFYKFALKESRFCSIMALCCLVFGNQVNTLSEVKILCARYGIAGHNRIIAILDFFRISGRVKMNRMPGNRRKISLEPTPKAIKELSNVLEGVFTPLKMMYPHCPADIERMNEEAFRTAFYFRAGESLSQGLLFDTIFPQAAKFIDKDAGRIFLLFMYQLACSPDNALEQGRFKALAKELRVSRSHFTMLVSLGVNNGFFIESSGSLMFTPSFFDFAEHYIALYLSWGYLFLPEVSFCQNPVLQETITRTAS